MSANLVAATVRSGLYTRIIGKRIRFFQELTSTMDLAREYAESKIDEGTVVIAESQTSSRGRLGRTWVSKPRNLYLSVGEGRLSDYESQDIDSLLGKILRIDVSKADPKAKVIAYGLRNPWKISIDSKSRMFIGDCGEATIESVYLLNDLNPTVPYNLGWPVFEGTKRITDDLLRFENTLAPIYEYKHHRGIGNCAIGGFFLDDLGVYVFGDYLGKIRFLKERQNGDWYEIHSQSTRGVLSLGMDTDANRIYMSGWDEIYEIKISRSITKRLPWVILCRTVMPNKVMNNTAVSYTHLTLPTKA